MMKIKVLVNWWCNIWWHHKLLLQTSFIVVLKSHRLLNMAAHAYQSCLMSQIFAQFRKSIFYYFNLFNLELFIFPSAFPLCNFLKHLKGCISIRFPHFGYNFSKLYKKKLGIFFRVWLENINLDDSWGECRPSSNFSISKTGSWVMRSRELKSEEAFNKSSDRTWHDFAINFLSRMQRWINYCELQANGM